MSLNLNDLMLTEDEIREYWEKNIPPNSAYYILDQVTEQAMEDAAQTAVAKFAWGLVDWLNARGDFMKAEVEPDRAAELWWASGTIVEALEAAGIPRPKENL